MITSVTYLREGVILVKPIRNLKWIVTITQKLIRFKLSSKLLLCSFLQTSGENIIFLQMRNSNSQKKNSFIFLSFKNQVLDTELDMVPAQWVSQSTMLVWFSFCSNSIWEHTLDRNLFTIAKIYSCALIYCWKKVHSLWKTRALGMLEGQAQ